MNASATAALLALLLASPHAARAGLARAPALVLTDAAPLPVPLAFDVTRAEAYPPRAFPAYYPPVNLPPGPVTVRVWNGTNDEFLVVQRAAPFAPGGPALNQIEFRVDGGPWVRGGAAQIVRLGAPPGWSEVRVEWRLRLEGTETAGAYATLLTWRLAPR